MKSEEFVRRGLPQVRESGLEGGLLELIPEFGGVFIVEDSLVNKESFCSKSLELQGVLAVRGTLVLLVWTEQGDVLGHLVFHRHGLLLSDVEPLEGLFEGTRSGQATVEEPLEEPMGEPLPPVRWGYRDMDVSFSFLFRGVAGDNSSVEVFEEVLRRRGSATGPTTLGGGILGAEAAGVDPPLVEVGASRSGSQVLKVSELSELSKISGSCSETVSVWWSAHAISYLIFGLGGLLELIPEFGGVFIVEDSLVNKESFCSRSLELQGVLAARGTSVLLVWTEQGDVLRPQGVLASRGSPRPQGVLADRGSPPRADVFQSVADTCADEAPRKRVCCYVCGLFGPHIYRALIVGRAGDLLLVWTPSGELREGAERVGFEVVTLDGRRGPLASTNISSRESQRWPIVGRYKVDVSSFESLALPELQVKEDTDLFIIDEVGKMELFSSSFFPAVLRVLESNIPLLASVPIPKSGRDIPGVARLKNHPGATTYTLNTSNRDAMKEQIYSNLINLLQNH
ncbi:UNVERIFIED_CONTAM: Cancer-related nucleoside-triphosphatase [Sesamum latifolium]|uniref:Cancer-related nucleoside-triphosphatase n=1 Tax=Sesamum latifolium TaxID=2727402 RepID=A0AAW2Y9M0_9LAMI